MKSFTLTVFAILLACSVQAKVPQFKVLAFAENGGHHLDYSKSAKVWLNQLAAERNFTLDYVEDTKKFTDVFLEQYQLIIQLDYPPYGWKPTEMEAFKKYLVTREGRLDRPSPCNPVGRF